MKTTVENDLLGEATKESKKNRKAKKADAAPAKAEKPKKEKKAKPEKEEAPAKAEKPKKEKKAKPETDAADKPTAVDQTPKEIARDHKLGKESIALLIFLHEDVKEATSSAELGVKLKTDTKTVNKWAGPLVDAGLVVKDEKAKTLDVVGNRQEGFGDLLKTIAKLTKDNGTMPTAAKVGAAIWADPKKPQKADSVRFGRAAGRLLKQAFRAGIITQWVQPRRKFSDAKVRHLYGVVE